MNHIRVKHVANRDLLECERVGALSLGCCACIGHNQNCMGGTNKVVMEVINVFG